MMRGDWKICAVLRYNFGGYFRHIKYILFSAFQKFNLVKSFLGPVEENNQIKNSKVCLPILLPLPCLRFGNLVAWLEPNM